jgi:putative transposase
MEEFSFDKAVKDILSGRKITGKNGVIAPLIKQLVEAVLDAEINSHITDEILQEKKNRRNGYNIKQVKSSDGEFELSTPRDREGSFECFLHNKIPHSCKINSPVLQCGIPKVRKVSY